MVEAASTVPLREERALYRIEAEALAPILFCLLGGAMVLFARAARRHRERLLAIADVAGRIGDGDLAARLNERGSDEWPTSPRAWTGSRAGWPSSRTCGAGRSPGSPTTSARRSQ